MGCICCSQFFMQVFQKRFFCIKHLTWQPWHWVMFNQVWRTFHPLFLQMGWNRWEKRLVIWIFKGFCMVIHLYHFVGGLFFSLGSVPAPMSAMSIRSLERKIRKLGQLKSVEFLLVRKQNERNFPQLWPHKLKSAKHFFPKWKKSFCPVISTLKKQVFF